MYNVEMKDRIINNFTALADANLEVAKTYGSIVDNMKADNVSVVKHLVKRVVEVVAMAVPEDIDVAGTSIFINLRGSEDMITTIEVTIKNKYSSKREFKFKKNIVYSESVFEVLADFAKCTYIELISDALINKNLEILNAKLEEICKEAGNTFKVKVISPVGGDGRKVVKITDDEIVFVADETRILNMNDILLFCEPTEFISEDVIKTEGFNKEVAIFASAQTTPQFLEAHDPLIGHICDISKLIKPITLIKKVYSKNVKKLRGNKESMAYFMEGDVFAVVHASEEGKEVALQPFNVHNLEVVDYDVLANI